MKKKTTKPDPLAKLSAPNLRRMVKRRDAEIARLEFSLKSLESMVSVGSLPDFDAWVANATPDIVICHVAAIEPGHWHRIVREGGEDTRTTIVPDNTPAEVQVPPFGAGMPGATLTQREVFSATVAWSWLYWDWRRNPLTCPTVKDTLEGRAALLGIEPVCLRPATFGIESRVWLAPPSFSEVTVVPATWRQA